MSTRATPKGWKIPTDTMRKYYIRRRRRRPSAGGKRAEGEGEIVNDVRLTDQERMVIAMFVRGFGSSATAKAMKLSLTHVKKLKRSIRAKMNEKQRMKFIVSP